MRDVRAEPVRMALVGLGGHGRTIQTAAEEVSGIEVAAVYDVNDELTAEAAERFGCTAAASFEDLLGSDDLEAVALITPNALHLEQASAAFDRGLHVFVEKPIANRLGDGLAIIRASERAGRRLMVGHNMRFGRAPERARQFVREGRLGEVVTVELHFSADNTRRMDPSTWRMNPSECPLLPVMQLGIHGIDLVHFFLAPIVEVHAFARSLTVPDGVVDSVSASMMLESGVTGTLVSNYCSQIHFEVRIAGTEASLRLTPHRLWFRANRDTDAHGEGPADEHDFRPFDRESYRRQLEVFAEAVAGEGALHPDGWDGLRALAVVDALERSAASGAPVTVLVNVPEEAS